MSYLCERSRVPIPIHVKEAQPKWIVCVDFVKSSVSFVMEFDEVSMSSIAEGSVRWVFAIAQLIVSTLAHVELNWPATSDSRVTGSVTTRIGLTHSASAPAVYFSLLQICVIGEPSYISFCFTGDEGNAWRSVFAFSVANTFGDGYGLISWEIWDIVWWWFFSGGGRLQDFWGRHKWIFKVCFSFH